MTKRKAYWKITKLFLRALIHWIVVFYVIVAIVLVFGIVKKINPDAIIWDIASWAFWAYIIFGMDDVIIRSKISKDLYLQHKINKLNENIEFAIYLNENDNFFEFLYNIRKLKNELAEVKMELLENEEEEVEEGILNN